MVENLIEVTLKSPEDFLKIKETLTRIGLASRRDNTLYQSCHILHKRQKYYIVHFKEMFMLDGRPSDFSDQDRNRRNTIANLLEEWGLVDIVNKGEAELPDDSSLRQVKVVTFKDKPNWNLVPKYKVGRK